jgi:hypothetical protein
VGLLRGVAHVLDCAAFGGSGMRTGDTVGSAVPRCGHENATCVLEHAVALGVAYPVRPASRWSFASCTGRRCHLPSGGSVSIRSCQGMYAFSWLVCVSRQPRKVFMFVAVYLNRQVNVTILYVI